ncbi:calmodulin-lysine N-methyltransferase [Drosophila albomicans]|uniref:Calmodulin-lysine N-methyltransferase n=1 Tax=Drosophila albomicans TaxID=7291 RepID=A0A6P8WK34_DROAB|nr:calmodulin-lysine N-methyltransferase [Drosophila albomicans]XP_034099649.1 calmodulin-lysine N-methyltransferase [Drosophila albomicans]
MSANLVQKKSNRNRNRKTKLSSNYEKQEKEAEEEQQQQLQQQQQQQTERKLTRTSPTHIATISLMLQYDIDNTLNALKEHTHSKTRQRNALMDLATNNHSNSSNSHNNNCNHNKDEDNNLEEMPSQTPISAGSPSVEEELEMEDIVTGKTCVGVSNGFMPPTPPATPNLQNTAQKRWRILAKVLRKDSEETVSSSSDEFSEEQTASVRRFKSFDLLRQDSFEDHVSLKCLGKTENWYKYRMQLHNDIEYSVNIHHMERQLTANDLMGFNNTGNICVWPSEEALTALVLSDLAAYRGKWILELGGGFTSLAGLMLAKYAKPYAVHLTDGNEVSVENVRKTVCLNELSCYTKCSVLKWQESAARAHAEQDKFEYILCADCLFFDEARSALVDTIWYYLAPHGIALIMAPRRGRTLNVFRDECVARGFRVELATRYNETIWQRHLQLKTDSALYDEDLHYPLLLRLCKSHS